MADTKEKVQLESKKPRTVQKTCRVPVYIVDWLEPKASAAGISVPAAMVQLIERIFKNDCRQA